MKKSFGNIVSEYRKEKGMTQLELAQKLGVSDKAVSKWERNLCYPDIQTIPQLSQILGVSVDELMQIQNHSATDDKEDILSLILKAVPLAMGIGILVLSFLNQLTTQDAISMIAIAIVALSLLQFTTQKK